MASLEKPHLYEASAAHDGTALAGISFAGALFIMLIVERFFNSILFLVARLVWGNKSGSGGCVDEPMSTLAHFMKVKLYPDAQGVENIDGIYQYLGMLDSSSAFHYSQSSSMQGYASMQMVGATVSFFSNIGTSISSSVVDGLTGLSSYIVWAVATTLFFSLLFLVQVTFPIPFF